MTGKKQEQRTVSDLHPAGYNPREITDAKREALQSSMDELGDLSGVVFNRRTNTLIGGHERRLKLPPDAAIEITKRWRKPNAQGTVAVGYIYLADEPWVYREVDVPVEREKLMNVAANQHGGEFDRDPLAELLAEIAEFDVDMDLTGFDEGELSEFLFDPDSIEPVGAEGQGKLDELSGSPVQCPKCGHEFTP